MLRCSIGLMCVLWAACSFAQSSPTPIATGSTAKVVCKSESEEVVLHATTSAALPIVDILPCGAEVTVVSKQAGWYRVRTKGGKEGYVKDTFLAATSPVGQATRHTKDGYIVCSPGATAVHLQESPNGFVTGNTKMHCGEKIDVLEEIPDKIAYKIETSDGNVGYVWSGSVSWSLPTADAAALEAQYKTCAKHSIPADKCTLEIYQQLKAKDEAALEQDQYVAPYAKPAPPADADVNLAVRGITMMRDSVLDPTSFTVLQVLVSPKSGGCVHYVASNTFGGRVQQWGIYGLDKKGRLSVSLLTSTVLYTQNIVDGCIKTSVRDVTAEVKKALPQEGGQ
jgi:hypothetical protein